MSFMDLRLLNGFSALSCLDEHLIVYPNFARVYIPVAELVLED